MDHQRRVYSNILELAANVDNPTPLVRLNRVVNFKHAVVYGKLEWFNPFGAVKDRVAANLVLDAEARGQLGPDTRLVEPTSGNTGMALAMIANAKGYRFTATVSNKVPQEKRDSLRLFGTQLFELEDDLCPAPGAPEGAIAKAAELGNEQGSFHLNQYKNPANPEAHFRTTGPEIWRQTGGEITHFFASLGTCGTVTGTGRFLKQQDSSVKVYGVHPAAGHDIPGVRALKQLEQTAIFAPAEYDGLVEVSNADAYEMCRRLNQEESIIAGPSSGMGLAGALRTIPDEPGVVAVVIFCDDAFKYSSSIRKHLPSLFPGKPQQASLAGPLASIIDLARKSGDVLDAQAAHTFLEQTRNSSLVDVRSLEEYEKQHPRGALNIPLAELAKGEPALLSEDKDTQILTVCKVGERSLHGMLLLKAQGYRNVKSVAGGLDAWLVAGLPTSRS
jgi:cysteine synthase/rhodanese-related sulfurtransferase